MSCISYLNTCPSQGDSESNLLGKILQVLNDGGGGGGGGGVTSLSVNGGPAETGAVSIGTVTSVNGDTGPAVMLDSDELPEGASNLYFTEARVLGTLLAGLVSQLGTITAADSVLVAFGKTQGRLAALEAGTAGPFVLRAGDTMTGPLVITPSATDVVPLTISGYSLTGANTQSALSITGTLNTSGAPTVLFVNVTNTASAAATLLFDFQLSATTVFNLRRDGRLILNGRAAFTDQASGIGHQLGALDANTASAPMGLILSHTLTGVLTGADGIGITFDWAANTDSVASSRMARWVTIWTTAANATRTSQTTFNTFVSATETAQMILGNNQVQINPGSVALPGLANRNGTNTGLLWPTNTTLAVSANATTIATFSSTTFTVSGSEVITATADTLPFSITGYSLTGANAQSGISLAGTWNTSGTPTALLVNITDTASNAASLLLDLQNSSTSVFKIRKDGRLSLNTTTLTTNTPAVVDIRSTWNFAGLAATMFQMILTDTASASTSFLIYTEVSSNTRFTVSKLGTISTIAAANSSAVTLQCSKTGSDATTGLSLVDTWNTSGNPSALKVQAVLTANGATSKLLHLVSGANPISPSDKFYVLYDGSTWQAMGSTIVAGGQTISAGGLTLTTGNITVTAGNITITSGRLSTAVATLVDAATIATDASLANHFRVTLGGNRTLGNPTNAYDGARIVYEVIQDGTGNRTLAFDTNFAFGSDITSVTLSTGINLRDFITVVYNAAATKWYVVAFVKGY